MVHAPNIRMFMMITQYLKTTISRNIGKAVIILAMVCFEGHSDLYYAQASQLSSVSDTYITHEIIFSGPRQEISLKIPDDPGFSSFAISVPNVISRSGQPTIIGFRWLKTHGWKGIVDLRVGGESGLIGDDTNIKEFKELHFNYLALPINNKSVPSDQQAQKFLEFVTNPLNQPIHVHCYAGVGRTGVMIALYRYMVQGWPIDKAISESRLFRGGVNKIQKNWLERWAQEHKPGSYGKPQRHAVVPK